MSSEFLDAIGDVPGTDPLDDIVRASLSAAAVKFDGVTPQEAAAALTAASAGRTGATPQPGPTVVPEFLVYPTGAGVDDPEAQSFVVRVVLRSADRYAVVLHGRCLHRNGSDWAYEGHNSGRGEDFERDYRMSLREALEHARRIVDVRKVNGRTWTDWETYRDSQ